MDNNENGVRRQASNELAAEMIDLSDLQLALIGGGSGEVSPY
jgi:hypothetical protein